MGARETRGARERLREGKGGFEKLPFRSLSKPATQAIITAVEPLPLFSVEAFYFSMIANFIATPSGKLCGGEKISTTATLETEEGTQPRFPPKCIDNTF